jgi:excisionase family DNA binding protein
MTLPDLLTLDEACAHVRLSPWALRRAIARGELRAYKPAGRIRISPDALAAWLESTAPAAEPVPIFPDAGKVHPRGSTEADTFRAKARRRTA